MSVLPEVCVVYVLRESPGGGAEVLLGRKRRGLGEGRIVAPGGKLEPGESPVRAAVRELAEEVGSVRSPAISSRAAVSTTASRTARPGASAPTSSSAGASRARSSPPASWRPGSSRSPRSPTPPCGTTLGSGSPAS
ncbi:NUDIX domain-containing protein [Rathayibacter oskolensis]|uniref:NUDIX domain-containing protein n=1 Tax=Rathayibacter oskolensis TaxID=1891671 RepID=UPI00265E431F|nr:NUDIX domain-containing protein [Rathayibacter oskolensis]WKK71641.1 NUDIX domain-containing protein [Rathayibacter oskolensis]